MVSHLAQAVWGLALGDPALTLSSAFIANTLCTAYPQEPSCCIEPATMVNTGDARARRGADERAARKARSRVIGESSNQARGRGMGKRSDKGKGKAGAGERTDWSQYPASHSASLIVSSEPASLYI